MKLWTNRLLSSLVLASVIAGSTLLLSPANAGVCCNKKMDTTKGCAVSAKAETDKPCEMMQNWENAVRLTAEQKTAIDKIRLDHEPERDHLHSQIKEAKETLRRLMEAKGNTVADENAVIAQVQAIGTLKTLAEVNHIKEAYLIKALLTPEQQKVSTEFWQDMWRKKEKMGYGGNEEKPCCTKKPCCGKLKLWNRSSKTEQSAKGCPISFKHKPAVKTAG